MMSKRCGTVLVGSLLALGGAVSVAGAQVANGIELPEGYAYPYSYVSTGEYYTPWCNPYRGGSSSASSTQTCNFEGVMSDGLGHTFDVGDFTTTQSASMIQGKSLHASTRLTGYVDPYRFVTFDAVSAFNDALTITGPYTPATVIFHAMIEGSATAPAVWGDVDPETGELTGSAGRFDFTLWNNIEDHKILGSNFTWSVPHDGVSGPRSASWSVPWAGNTYENTLYYQMSLVAFGRFNTLDVGQDVDIYSDYSHTATFDGVSVYDAGGNDITSAMTLKYASAPVETTTTPEPGSLALFGSGFLGLVAQRRRASRRG
jgi:hypothetical protein